MSRVASKFFEHSLYVPEALNNIGGTGIPLWDEDGQFLLRQSCTSRTASLCSWRLTVGLMPLLGRRGDRAGVAGAAAEFQAPHGLVSRWQEPGAGERRLLALVRGHRMMRLLKGMLDPRECSSEYGIRAIRWYQLECPFRVVVNFVLHEPGESSTGLCGGNSNWRGPIWFPINFLIVETGWTRVVVKLLEQTAMQMLAPRTMSDAASDVREPVCAAE